MNARIIRANSGRPLPSAAESFASSGRRIAAEQWQALLEAERILGEARMAAEKIRDEAENAGRAKGKAEADARAIAVLSQIDAERAAIVDSCVQVVVAATRAVCERAMKQALSVDDATLAGWAREAIASLKSARRIQVRGARKVIDRLALRLAELAPSGAAVELLVDDSLDATTLVAHSDVGDVRLELTTQLDDLLSAIHGTVSTAVKVRRG